jgi:hypothetical protein
MIRHPKTAGWLALNVIGAAAYIRVASRSWVEPELANVPEAHGGGAAFVWFLGAAPILFAFLVLNLGVVAWAFSQRRGEPSGRSPSWQVWFPYCGSASSS